MKFSFYRIKKRLWSQKIIYVVIAVQLAIGASLLCFSFNQYFVEKGKYDKLAKSLTKDRILIDYNQQNPLSKQGEAITAEDYKVLRERYQDQAVLEYRFLGNLSFLRLEKGKKESELQTLTLVFLSKEEMKKLFEQNIEKKGLYAGQSALDFIHQMKSYTKEESRGSSISSDTYLSVSTNLVDFTEKGLCIDGQIYTFQEIKSSVQEKKIFTSSYQAFQNETGITLENCLFFPLEQLSLGKKIFQEGNTVPLSVLSIQEKNFQDGIAFEVMEYLNEVHKGEYTYSLGSESMQAKLQLDFVTSKAKSYMLLSVLQILLVSFCSSSIFSLIFAKRKKDISMSIMVGSTKKQQVFELVTEIFLVIIIGLLAGFLFFCFAKEKDVGIPFGTIITLLFVALVTTAISSSLTLKDLYRISPIEILKK